MENTYNVRYGHDTVGKVQVIRQGLYYRFICTCQLEGDVVCRLGVRCGDKNESLGVVVPVEQGFGLDRKIPVKNLGEGKMDFYLVPKHDKLCGEFIPIYPEEPFSYIERLKDTFLSYQNGKPGVILMDT